MNKYKEALKWIGEQPILNEFGEEISDIKNDGSTKKEFNLLQELIDKEEKYRWHDLTKNPDDLPEDDEYVYVAWQGGTNIWYDSAFYHADKRYFSCYGSEHTIVGESKISNEGQALAWRDIEPCEGECKYE